MKPNPSGSTKLSSKHTVRDYLRMENERDQKGIAAMILLRHRERYVNPVECSPAKHGFALMALACLLIETIQSFREGLEDTKGQSRKMFRDFLKAESGFAEFAAIADSFYEDIRCGILHQGESRAGWTIKRQGPLIDKQHQRLNATRFLRAVDASLSSYCHELEESDWGGGQWEMCRKKMEAIVANCQS
jgi:hypothetical protein